LPERALFVQAGWRGHYRLSVDPRNHRLPAPHPTAHIIREQQYVSKLPFGSRRQCADNEGIAIRTQK